jgi:hypothetical protein
MGFDVRMMSPFPFQVRTIVGLLALLMFFRLIDPSLRLLFARNGTSNQRPDRLWLRRWGCRSILAALIVAGLLMRIRDLDVISLSHDEISMISYTKGLFQRGFPSRDIGPVIKHLTTYEILPYSIALPVMFLGWSDFSVRFHSVLLGTLEILLLYLLGRMLFDRTIGLVAALIITFHPWCVGWSQNVFYPQLTQLLATLTVIFLWQASDASTFPGRRKLYLAAIAFGMTYLSWEGTGFMLPTLMISLFMIRGRVVEVLKNKHVWGALLLVILVVFMQQSRRFLYQLPYTAIGAGIADVSFPTLFFLDPLFDPWFYFKQFLLIDNNVILSLTVLAGLPLIFRSRPLRVTYALLLLTMATMTLFLQNVANRYTFFLEPFLILGATASAIFIVRFFAQLLPERGAGRAGIPASMSGILLVAMLFFSSNHFLTRLFFLSVTADNPSVLVQPGVYWNDYRTPCRYIADHYRPGDVVFVTMSHTLQYYAGITGDYSLTTNLGRTLIFLDEGDSEVYIDKYAGIQTLTSLAEFKNMTDRAKRIWFVAAPESLLLADNDQSTIDYIVANFTSVYESYNAKVYLWEK